MLGGEGGGGGDPPSGSDKQLACRSGGGGGGGDGVATVAEIKCGRPASNGDGAAGRAEADVQSILIISGW